MEAQRASKDNCTQDRLKQLLNYDPEAGTFTWLIARGVPAGKRAGSIDSHGYRLIRIDGILYRSCRLAWLFMTGAWPAHQIDHVNMVRSDDRWVNLRIATNGQNNMNRRVRKDSTSGLKGASWNSRSGKWLSTITADGRTRRLGLFDTPMEAHKKYMEAAKKLHGEFARFS